MPKTTSSRHASGESLPDESVAQEPARTRTATTIRSPHRIVETRLMRWGRRNLTRVALESPARRWKAGELEAGSPARHCSAKPSGWLRAASGGVHLLERQLSA